jgi:hypothetical protein
MELSMRSHESRPSHAWLRDPFLFSLALLSLAFVTVALAVTGRLFSDPALICLAIISLLPAFWLFYQRDRARPPSRRGERPPRRR